MYKATEKKGFNLETKLWLQYKLTREERFKLRALNAPFFPSQKNTSCPLLSSFFFFQQLQLIITYTYIPYNIKSIQNFLGLPWLNFSFEKSTLINIYSYNTREQLFAINSCIYVGSHTRQKATKQLLSKKNLSLAWTWSRKNHQVSRVNCSLNTIHTPPSYLLKKISAALFSFCFFFSIAFH